MVPIDGMWVDGGCYFGGDPATVHIRNLRRDGRATLHLEDGESAVIVEGTAEWVTPSKARRASGLPRRPRPSTAIRIRPPRTRLGCGGCSRRRCWPGPRCTSTRPASVSKQHCSRAARAVHKLEEIRAEGWLGPSERGAGRCRRASRPLGDETGPGKSGERSTTEVDGAEVPYVHREIRPSSAAGHAGHGGAIRTGLQPDGAGVVGEQRILDSDGHIKISEVAPRLESMRYIHQTGVRPVLILGLDRSKIGDQVAHRVVQGRILPDEPAYQVKIKNEPPQRGAGFRAGRIKFLDDDLRA